MSPGFLNLSALASLAKPLHVWDRAAEVSHGGVHVAGAGLWLSCCMTCGCGGVDVKGCANMYGSFDRCIVLAACRCCLYCGCSGQCKCVWAVHPSWTLD
jgi:hypothetical protein